MLLFLLDAIVFVFVKLPIYLIKHVNIINCSIVSHPIVDWLIMTLFKVHNIQRINIFC